MLITLLDYSSKLDKIWIYIINTISFKEVGDMPIEDRKMMNTNVIQNLVLEIREKT